MDTGRIDPPVVEVEQRAHRDREIERFVGPTGRPHNGDIRISDRRRRIVHLVDEPKQRLVLFVEPGRPDIRQYRFDERLVAKQLRRNCGVRFQSKWAMVTPGRVCGNQLAQPGTERCGPAEDFLRETSEVLRRFWQIRE